MYYVHNTITPIILLSFSNAICDGLVVRVPEHDTIYFSVYRPPYFNDTDNQAFQEVLDQIQNIVNESLRQVPGCNNIIGFGDYNLPKFNWFSEGFPQVPGKSGNEFEIYNAFHMFAQNNFPFEKISTSTRGKNILDLILTIQWKSASYI